MFMNIFSSLNRLFTLFSLHIQINGMCFLKDSMNKGPVNCLGCMVQSQMLYVHKVSVITLILHIHLYRIQCDIV